MSGYGLYRIPVTVTVVAECRADAEALIKDMMDDEFIRGEGKRFCKINAEEEPAAQVVRLYDYNIRGE